MGVLKVLKEKSITNFMVYGIGQGFNLVTPLLVAPYLISVCGEDGFGKISTGLAISFLLIVIIDYGSDITGVKEVAVNRENKQKLEKTVGTTYIAKALLVTVVLAFMSILYLTVPYFSKEKELYLLALPILVGQFINPTWVFQGVENFKWITILNILSKVIYVAGVFCFIKTSNDYIYANLWWGLGMIIANTIAFLYLKNHYEISFKATSFNEVKEYLKDNFSIFSSQAVLSLQMYSPVILVKLFMGDAAAGMYAIVERIVVMFRTYILLFFNYVFPRVCYLLDTNAKKAIRFWKLFNGANFIFIAIAMLLLFVLSIPVVTYFKAESVNEISDLLRLGTAIPLTFALSVPLKQLILGWNYNRQYTRITMIMVVVNLTGIIAVMPFYKLQGVLVTFIVTEFVTGLLFLSVIKNRLKHVY
ncbi:oligosaccharide flippase family protein [Flavobacterium rakeshii]|uniref:oligosaccharide flippase family protein n=1 Tax=Flavobacterium rakeshii TaxID=1038845 RepID=UPI002E7AAFE7|nr:oligosaccharide flippase family protein [Flavobacterium rakeshii]MEE1897297.1 oligosaccharide flippase family protein [Flavobacterium rakeshii]